MIKAVINLDSPRPQVFSVFTDYSKYTHWLPGCEQATITSSSGNTTDLDIVVRSMKTMKMGLRFEATPEQLLAFRMISGKDIKAYTGSYRLMDAADGRGTVVLAELEIDAGAMAPRFLVDRMAKKAIDDTGAALKKYLLTMTAPVMAARPRVVAEVRKRRTKRILQVVKTPHGHRIWMLGQTYNVRD